MKREEGEKQKRKANPKFDMANKFKKFIKEELDGEKVNKVGPLTKIAFNYLKETDYDLAKAKKKFNKKDFMKEYTKLVNEAEKKKKAK